MDVGFANTLAIMVQDAQSQKVLAAWAVAIVCVLVVAVWILIQKRVNMPPSPLVPPLLGDTVGLYSKGTLGLYWPRLKKYGPVFRTQLLNKPLYVVADINIVRQLTRNDELAHFDLPFASFKMLMGDANPMADANAHGVWRKLFTAAVGPASLESFVPRVNEVMDAYMARWGAAGRVEMYSESRRMGVDLAVDVITGLHIRQSDPAWLKERLGTFMQGLYGIPLALPGTDLSKALKAKAELLKALVPEVEAGYRQAVAKLGSATSPKEVLAAFQEPPQPAGDGGAGKDQQQQQGGAAAPGEAGRARVSIPEAQLSGFWMLGKRGVEDAALGVLHNVVAGGDTTRVALLHTWTLLASSPRVQQAAYQEQLRVIEKHGEEITYEAAMTSMPYMDAMVKEAMRLLPASQGGMRRLDADVVAGRYTLPKGSMVWYIPLLLHALDPVMWDGSSEGAIPPHMDITNLEAAFRPERWLAEDTRPRHSFTFGNGLHLCVGMGLVYLEVKLLLCRMVRHFTMELATPDMVARAVKFPFIIPQPGTDTVLLHRRQEPAATAA